MGLGGDECVLILVVEDEDVGLIEVALDGAWGVVKEDDDLVEVVGVRVSSSSSKVRSMRGMSLVIGLVDDWGVLTFLIH